jgi:hypothetical protein
MSGDLIMERYRLLRDLVRSALLMSCGLGCALLTVGCQRSSAYRKDQDFYKTDSTSYYSGKSKSPTQRAETLGQPKKKVAVFGFWNNTPIKQQDIGLFVADELKRGLFLSQRMVVPTELNDSQKGQLRTEDYIDGEQVRVAQLIREGRRLGVGVLVIGRLKKVVFRQKGDDIGLLRQKVSVAAVDMEIKVFDVAAGREVLAAARSGEASSNALTAFEEMDLEGPLFRAELTKLAARHAASLLVGDVIKAVEKMTWEGRIAKMTGGKVYINAGRASGLVTGDILKVLSVGDDIYDPVTGAFLGRAQGQLKGTLEVMDFLGTDGAIAEVHTGGNIAEGDLVQLY